MMNILPIGEDEVLPYIQENLNSENIKCWQGFRTAITHTLLVGMSLWETVPVSYKDKHNTYYTTWQSYW